METGSIRRFTIRKERIVHQWNALVEKGAGRQQWVLDKTSDLIKQANMPNVVQGFVEAGTGMFSDKRLFLVVRHSKLKDYNMFIGARDFGIHLDAAWFVLASSSDFKRFLSRYTGGDGVSLNVDIFSQQDIGAFINIAHLCFKEALESLSNELKQDPSGLNVRSKGFLNVW